MERWKRKERARLTWEGRQEELSMQVQSKSKSTMGQEERTVREMEHKTSSVHRHQF